MAETEMARPEEHGHSAERERAEGGERVKTAREILEEKLARMKSEAPAAEEALKHAAERAAESGAPPRPASPAEPAPGPDERVAKAEKECLGYKNEALRARADLDNYQKRIRREMDELRTFATAGVLSEVVAVLDNLDLTLEASRKTPDVATLCRGVEIVREQLEKLLRDRGAERIPAENVPFDPRKHEAVLVEDRDDLPTNTATQELRRGYALKDRVLRAAQVKVSRAPQAPS